MYEIPTASSWFPGWTIAAEAKARTPLIRSGQSTNGSRRERRRTRSSHRASRTGRRNELGPCVPTHSWRSTRELEARTTPQTSPARSRNSGCDELGFYKFRHLALPRVTESQRLQKSDQGVAVVLRQPQPERIALHRVCLGSVGFEPRGNVIVMRTTRIKPVFEEAHHPLWACSSWR